MASIKKRRPSDLLDNTIYLIMDIGRLYRRQFDAQMRTLELPRAEWWLITHLWFFEGCTQQELADILDMDKAGLAKLLDRLAHKGLIVRDIDTRDARQRRIRFADAARGFAQQVDAAAVRTASQSERDFKPIEVAAMRGLLRRLRATLLDNEHGLENSTLQRRSQARRRKPSPL